MEAKKPSMGRQKIKIAKIQVKNHLQVTFSKRRSGLMKKASELCTICGVDIGIIVFSPAGKVFPFGHPNIETIIDRFLTGNSFQLDSDTFRLVEAHRNASLRELNLHLTQLLNELEIEKKRSESFDNIRKASQKHYWWEAPIDEIGFQELLQLKDSMEELRKVVLQYAGEFMTDITNYSSSSLNLFDHCENKSQNMNLGSYSNSNIHSHFLFV
ncbi:hypothetical protein M9H77_20542 [Catharanthus roseus]|uniref:Uncharacterized protein n=1 Tax=Catharanthus roseus TaxID=4058 RepID=A0ACC0AKV9_CATRO|nr:hypothetical protein M9H77_20542 [Catharanthus roseus]